MLRHIRPAIVLLTLLTGITGLAYPLAITGLAQLIVPQKANGSIISLNGTPVGSTLIGQSFTAPKYFHGRPSATQAQDPNDAGKTVDAPYNGTNSSGSNLGPTSQKLIDRVRGDVAALQAQGRSGPIAADAVTTSASGLDPDISPDNARQQIETVALARNMAADKIAALVARTIRQPVLGLFGEPRVNVLQLNMELDRL